MLGTEAMEKDRIIRAEEYPAASRQRAMLAEGAKEAGELVKLTQSTFQSYSTESTRCFPHPISSIWPR
jgi:hypothetical protein